MGCSISHFDKLTVDFKLYNNNESNSIEFISSSLQLINFFPQMYNVPKCIFMFGSFGSNKGEFIYEMICSSWNNYKIEQMYFEHQENQKKNFFSSHQQMVNSSKNLNTNLGNLKVKKQLNKECMDNLNVNLTSSSENSLNQKVKLEYENNIDVFFKSIYQKQIFGNHNSKDSYYNLSNHDFKQNISNFVYSYIDLEKLIIENLNARIKELNNVDIIGIESKFNFNKKIVKKDKLNSDDKMNLNSKKSEQDEDKRKEFKDKNLNLKDKKQTLDDPECKYWMKILETCKEDFENNNLPTIKYKLNDLKEVLKLYSNCVTNNWILNLIEKEILTNSRKRYEGFKSKLNIDSLYEDDEKDEVELNNENSDEERASKNYATTNKLDSKMNSELKKQLSKIPETIYIITIVPNQINIFRECLFLKQRLNLNNFKLNYIAVNLVCNDFKKKDLDSVIVSHPFYDKINLNYLNYFRDQKKLINIHIHEGKKKFKLKVSKNKQAIKINNEFDMNVLLDNLEDNLQINLNNFESANNFSKEHEFEKDKKSILFLVNNEIDLGDIVLKLEDSNLDLNRLKNFVKTYHKQKKI